MAQPSSVTRSKILRAALKRFAHCGYVGTSVQDIVDAAKVTKPALYYYFKSKAGLYQALLDWAYDERLRVMQEASLRNGVLADQLTNILTDLFEFMVSHRELMRIGFATAFAALGEIPAAVNYLKKAQRNFEYLHDLVKKGLAAGALNKKFTSRELTMGIFGMLTIYVMAYLVEPKKKLGRKAGESIVQLYLSGAAGGHFNPKSAGA